MKKITIKRGDSLVLNCQYLTTYPGGTAIPLTDYTIRAQVRTTGGALVADLTTTITSAPSGEYQITYPAGTASWTPRTYHLDIEYTDADGVIRSTETVALIVERDITRD